MTRDAEKADKTRYQTIYARTDGSVAAPTAGLHFTDQTIEKLKEKNISIENVILHVGAGTFKPVDSETIQGHEMHQERIIVSKDSIESVLQNLENQKVAVGTTTLRTLESVYWFGVKLLVDKQPGLEIDIGQWDPYQPNYNINISVKAALENVLDHMSRYQMTEISGRTQLIIVPGYEVKIPDVLITNFHMPKSTLLLLVAAFIGPGWKQAYNFALDNQFRFLSYGDSCLFFKQNA
jgi:S-adenosylmethionine:tRNA ribosyltransferase-isomerase